MLVRKKITLYGIVQGVGFRPFIHRLVKKYKLNGWICNSNQGVEMEVEGEKSAYQDFLKDLKNHPPSLALIVDIKIKNLPIAGYSEFFIKESNSQYQHPIILIPPDISICEDCLRELNNPLDRRYHYPFINCTNCGPRFTIIKDMPYDRKQTTMQEFPMCTDCAREFHDLENRRYHAEPNACPVCGPQVSLYIKNKKIDTPEPIPEVRERLQKGEIGIIKGLGGFHLACDARNEEAVLRVRAIKKRDKKPFALMAENISTIKNYCFVSALASRYLESREKPILLLKKKRICRLSPDIAPGNAYLGFMLPYTPLHFLLMQKSGLILVMTSANFSEEPIIIEDKKAFQEFGQKVDFMFLHNRQIYNRCDDSVLKMTPHQPIYIRRSRGYAPYPVILSRKTKSILALGAEEKNTFCLMRDRYAFPSQHLGDLKNKENFTAYQEAIQRLSKVLQFEPEAIACDLHPDYLSTHYAEQLARQKRVPLVKVQHHHAHIVSCMVENHITEKVIGVAFDGTGFGSDGTIWGGEFLVVSPKDFQRAGYLKYMALPGGEQAIIEPWRMAYSYLYSFFGPDLDSIPLLFRKRKKIKDFLLLKQMIDKKINSPPTSSCGRLFDAVASLIGLKDEVDFEGQAAIELESICRPQYKDNYNYHLDKEAGCWVVNSREMFQEIIKDLESNTPLSKIATQFHNTIADFILSICVKIREDSAINGVALSGGVFQNSVLLTETIKKLKKSRFKVLIHKKLPPNDACISLGQAIVADTQIKSGIRIVS